MRFFYEITTGRYRDSSRRLVREQQVRAGLDSVIAAEAGRMRTLTQDLIDGKLALGAWQAQMMQSIKSVHLVGLALGNGGWANLNQSDYGWVGQRIRKQYRYLSRFARQLASGKQPLNAQAVARAALYAAAARATHREAQRRQAKARGMDQERNQLGAADHCRGCLAETRIGWAPIGTLVPVGSRDCLANCHCTLIYRRTPIEGGPTGRTPIRPVGSGQPGGGGAFPPPGPAGLERESIQRYREQVATQRELAEFRNRKAAPMAATVSNKPWSSFSASDYTPEQWKRACLIVMGDGSTKDQAKLPVREPDGSLNVNAVHAAAAVLAGGRGGVSASPAQKRVAAKMLLGLYRQIGDQPPDSLKRLAGG